MKTRIDWSETKSGAVQKKEGKNIFEMAKLANTCHWPGF